jgi:hypothetical protein
MMPALPDYLPLSKVILLIALAQRLWLVLERHTPAVTSSTQPHLPQNVMGFLCEALDVTASIVTSAWPLVDATIREHDGSTLGIASISPYQCAQAFLQYGIAYDLGLCIRNVNMSAYIGSCV